MGTPASQLVARMMNARVTLQLKDSRVITGKLVGCDDHLNLVLDEVEETTATVSRRLGLIVLRGSNVVSLNAPGGPATGRA